MGWTHKELLELASKQKLRGRSKMSKAELIQALDIKGPPFEDFVQTIGVSVVVPEDQTGKRLIRKKKEIKLEHLTYVGIVVPKNTGSKGKWKVAYECSKETQRKPNGRVYFIVVNGQIYKIGASDDKGGIRSTFSFYEGGLTGSPSLSRFGIHMAIQEQLDAGNEIKIYVQFNEPINIRICGLFSCIDKLTYPRNKDMEDLCREDYKELYGAYPIWNFQESHKSWPVHIEKAYIKYKNEQSRKKKSRSVSKRKSRSVSKRKSKSVSKRK